MTAVAAPARPRLEPPAGRRERLVAILRAGMEGVLLLLVALAPWAFGAVHPLSEFVLLSGLSVLLVLWAARMAVEGRLSWRRCPVAVCLNTGGKGAATHYLGRGKIWAEK